MPIKGVPFLALKKRSLRVPQGGSNKVLMAFGWINAGLLVVLFVDVKGKGAAEKFASGDSLLCL